MDGFLDHIEREAKSETERVLKELTSLKYDAGQVISVLNALKLEVPQELRELSPIEVVPKSIQRMRKYVPKPEVLVPERKVVDRTSSKVRGRAGGLKGSARNKEKAEEKYQQTRAEVFGMLSKGPRLMTDIVEQVDGSEHFIVNITLRRMKKEGEVGQRTSGFQGPSEWFLIERPVSLEAVRDAAVKKEGDIPLEAMQHELGFKDIVDLMVMLDELVAQGIITEYGDGGGMYTYMKPRSGNIPRTLDELGVKGRRNGAVAGTGRRSKLSSDKEVQQILAMAEAQGAQTKKQGNGHIIVKYKGGVRILAATPGDSNRSNREKLKDLGINV